jgi:hypothetical protein
MYVVIESREDGMKMWERLELREGGGERWARRNSKSNKGTAQEKKKQTLERSKGIRNV